MIYLTTAQELRMSKKVMLKICIILRDTKYQIEIAEIYYYIVSL